MTMMKKIISTASLPDVLTASLNREEQTFVFKVSPENPGSLSVFCDGVQFPVHIPQTFGKNGCDSLLVRCGDDFVYVTLSKSDSRSFQLKVSEDLVSVKLKRELSMLKLDMMSFESEPGHVDALKKLDIWSDRLDHFQQAAALLVMRQHPDAKSVLTVLEKITETFASKLLELLPRVERLHEPGDTEKRYRLETPDKGILDVSYTKPDVQVKYDDSRQNDEVCRLGAQKKYTMADHDLVIGKPHLLYWKIRHDENPQPSSLEKEWVLSAWKEWRRQNQAGGYPVSLGILEASKVRNDFRSLVDTPLLVRRPVFIAQRAEESSLSNPVDVVSQFLNVAIRMLNSEAPSTDNKCTNLLEKNGRVFASDFNVSFTVADAILRTILDSDTTGNIPLVFASYIPPEWQQLRETLVDPRLSIQDKQQAIRTFFGDNAEFGRQHLVQGVLYQFGVSMLEQIGFHHSDLSDHVEALFFHDNGYLRSREEFCDSIRNLQDFLARPGLAAELFPKLRPEDAQFLVEFLSGCVSENPLKRPGVNDLQSCIDKIQMMPVLAPVSDLIEPSTDRRSIRSTDISETDSSLSTPPHRRSDFHLDDLAAGLKQDVKFKRWLDTAFSELTHSQQESLEAVLLKSQNQVAQKRMIMEFFSRQTRVSC